MGEHRPAEHLGERGPPADLRRADGRRGPRGHPARLHPEQRHNPAPRADRGALPRVERGPDPGDHRHRRGQLPLGPDHPVARRRGGGDDPELHADHRGVPLARRPGHPVPPGGGKRLAARPGRAGRRGQRPDEDDPRLQPEQPERRGADRARDGPDRGRRRALRSVAARRRGLSRRRTERRGVSDLLGPDGPDPPERRSVEGVRAAGPARRLDRDHRGEGDRTMEPPRLQQPGAERDVRPAGPDRPRQASGRFWSAPGASSAASSRWSTTGWRPTRTTRCA